MRQLAVLLLAWAVATPAWAQDDPAPDSPPPESVKGIKVVIPEARGQATWGRAALSKAVRRAMTDAVGPLLPSRDLEAAQKKLKLKGSKAFEPEGLAKAAREIGAQYVLAVTLSKKGWLFTARAMLVKVDDGSVQMDFRAQYFKPTTEAADRGKRIGRRTIEKLAQLVAEGGAVAVAPPPPPPSDDRVVDDRVDDRTVDDRVDDQTDEPPPIPPPGRTDRTDDPPPPPVVVADAPPPAPPPSPPPPPAAQQIEVEAEPTESREEIIRAMVGGGAGVLRTYTISSDAVETSRLSHQLNPLSLVNLEIEFTIPSVPIAIQLGGAFRPVRYDLGVSDASPRGALIDSHVDIGYNIALSGKGLNAYELTPRVGGRFGVYTVQENPGNSVLSANVISVTGGLAVRLPINSVLEIDLGFDGGAVLAYAEQPASTGDSGIGFVVAGDLGARIWLTPMIAIAFDNRFTFESIPFSGSPTRQLPPEELAIQDANITTKDLRAAIGVAFRF